MRIEQKNANKRVTLWQVNSKKCNQGSIPQVQMLKALGSTILIVLFSSGCGQQNPEFEPQSADAEYSSNEQMIEESDLISTDIPITESVAPATLKVDNLFNTSEPTLGVSAADIQVAGKRLVITASADFKVKDVVKSRSAIENMTYQYSGYVASSSISNVESDSRSFSQGDQDIILTTYNRQAQMSVRIPKVNVNKFLEQIQQQVAFLEAQTFSAQDVTLDIYREQLAGQLSADMADELKDERLGSQNSDSQGSTQNSNVDAITATYAARQQQEYARLQQMDIADRIKYSTIMLTFTQPDVSYKETTQNLDLLIEAERPSFAVQIQQAFKEGWQMLREAAITIVSLWWLVVLGVIFYLIYRLIKATYRQVFKRKYRQKLLERKPPPKKKNTYRSDDNP